MQGPFQSYQEEIQRRRDVAMRGVADSQSFTRSETGTTHPFHLPSQQWVVFSLSQKEFAPVTRDPLNPAVCIHGAFPAREVANAEALRIASLNPNISVFVDETHKLILAASTPARLTDASHVSATLQRIRADHEDATRQNRDDFDENVQSRRTGDQKDTSRRLLRDTSERVQKDVVPSHNASIAHGTDTRGQRFAVVAFQADLLPRDNCAEFAFIVYACFDDERSCDEYVRNTCGDRVVDADIDIVATCEWCFPQTMLQDKVPREVFRSEELDKIMKMHRAQPSEVERVCREAGVASN